MKKLIDASPQELLDWVARGVNFLHFVPTELIKPNEEEEPLRADRYLAVEQDGEQAIVHLEIPGCSRLHGQTGWRWELFLPR